MRFPDDILVAFGQRVRQLRLDAGLSQEAFASECGLDRTYIGGIERGQRNVALRNISVIAQALGLTVSELLEGHVSKPMSRDPDSSAFLNEQALDFGLTKAMVTRGIRYVYHILDTIDTILTESGSTRLAKLVELADLSSILGNLFATGIVHAADGVFDRAGPHKYQDLRASKTSQGAKNIEIKFSLERNKPKGHLPKSGPYLTCRYVLGTAAGRYTPGQRGDTVWIWEVRFGQLQEEHFNVSNTAGDSGKTAVVNPAGMDALVVVYCDRTRCPYTEHSKYLSRLAKVFPTLPLL